MKDSTLTVKNLLDIKSIIVEKRHVEFEAEEKIEALDVKLNELMFELFRNDYKLIRTARDLDESEKYRMSDPYDGYIERFDFFDVNEFCRRYPEIEEGALIKSLDSFLVDGFCIYLDANEGIISMIDGPALFFTKEGVYDSEDQKLIFKREDLEDLSEEEIFDLIDDYQNKQGVFNGVFRDDGHGNITVVKEYSEYLNNKSEGNKK